MYFFLDGNISFKVIVQSLAIVLTDAIVMSYFFKPYLNKFPVYIFEPYFNSALQQA